MFKKIRGKIPNNRIARFFAGIFLIIGGILGFLPVLGFWMIPLGLLILSTDFPAVRRFRRRQEVKVGRWWKKRKASITKDSHNNRQS
ncbi:PGPGW domain-containing protein [Temperatibacter marinus]|uniref:PGPGW domain-containing protein n=1 Tax=Temperatibacter marinus TaxID=1456591 RepID=A0AA52EH58_9PROT|nr:PGPGW domain-containing protein [Temperatibacter marinus]WND02442.1 PGPGW domain-containing protein [Temperatibacter marinus]